MPFLQLAKIVKISHKPGEQRLIYRLVLKTTDIHQLSRPVVCHLVYRSKFVKCTIPGAPAGIVKSITFRPCVSESRVDMGMAPCLKDELSLI